MVFVLRIFYYVSAVPSYILTYLSYFFSFEFNMVYGIIDNMDTYDNHQGQDIR